MTRKLWIGIACVFALVIPILILYGIFGVDRMTPPNPLTENEEQFSVEDALIAPQKTELLPLVQEPLSEPEAEPEVTPEPEPSPEPEPEVTPEPENEPDAEQQTEETPHADTPGETDGDTPDDTPGDSEEDPAVGGEDGPIGEPSDSDEEEPSPTEDPENPQTPAETDDPIPEDPDSPRPSHKPDRDKPDHGGDEDPEEPEEKTPRILTDLRTQTVTAADGDGDTYPLSFSAELLDGEEDMELCVFYRSVSPSGTFLDSGELFPTGTGYEMALEEGTHTFTFRIRQNGKLLAAPQESRIVTWSTNKYPPTISAYLGNIPLPDGCTVENKTQEPLLKVSAKDYQGKIVPISGIKVWMDGTLLNNYTGSSVKEYKLWLAPPDEGDCAIHTITVQAQDAEGQTSVETYTIEFTPIAEGDPIGSVTVYFDCTTVGLGLLDSGMTVEIRQGYPASYVLKDCLESYGWDFTYSGGLGGPGDPIGGFYLKSIVGPDFSYANPSRLQPELWTCIQNDGLEIDPSLKPSGALRKGDELGEFDFTSGSGWMYEVNGYYPGRSLSEYYLQDGDVLTLRFTLAYGKDIGQRMKNSGQFDSYCRTWVNDGMYPAEHPESWYETEEIPATCTETGELLAVCPCCGDEVSEEIPALGHEFRYETETEPTCTETGLRRGVCSRCEETEEEEIPALGHEFQYETETEPTCTEAGLRRGICSHCGETVEEELSPTGHTETETERTEPDCTQDGEAVFLCEVCGAERRESLPAPGHRYEYTVTEEADCTQPGNRRGVCTACGEEIDESIPALGHGFENGTCIRCGAADPAWVPAEPPGGEDNEEEEE